MRCSHFCVSAECLSVRQLILQHRPISAGICIYMYNIIELVDCICRDSTDMQYMIMQKSLKISNTVNL